MTDGGVSWDRLEWRDSSKSYCYEVLDGGKIARLNISDGRSLILPIASWEAMFDAIKINRKSKARSASNLPDRAGSRWTDTESGVLTKEFHSGLTFQQLAQRHSRTIRAIESQLFKLGLWDQSQVGSPTSCFSQLTGKTSPDPSPTIGINAPSSVRHDTAGTAYL